MTSLVKGWALGELEGKAMDTWNGYAEKHLQTKDPYRYETPDGKTKKLKLNETASKEDQKMWKWVQKRAWLDDKCFMGCYPVDCGIGLGPLAVMIPVIGPFLMYGVHARLATRAGEYWHLDTATVAKMQANILFDFLISLPPLIGSFLVWLNGCSTRNAAIIHTEVTKMLLKQQRDVERLNENSSKERDAQLKGERQEQLKQKQRQQLQQQKQQKSYEQPQRPQHVQQSNSYNILPAGYQPKYGTSVDEKKTAATQPPPKVATRGPAIPHIPYDEPPPVPPRN